jgi:hypothetical protein
VIKRPGIFQRGTARELADFDEGYSCNGESVFSRQAAQAQNVTMRSNAPKTSGRHSQAALIAENVSQMAKLRGDLLLTDDPIKRARIEKNLDIKQRFIARLEAE